MSNNSFNNQNNGNNKTTTPNGGPPFAAHLKADGPEPPSLHDAALDGTAQQPGATPSAAPPGPEPPLVPYASFSGMAQQPPFASPPGLPLLPQQPNTGPKPFSVPYASYSGDTAQQPDENAPPVAGTARSENAVAHVKELVARVKSLTIENAELKAVSSVNLALYHAGAPPVDSPYSSPESEMIHANVDLIIDQCNRLSVESETSELAVEILKQQLTGLNQQLAAANTRVLGLSAFFSLTQIESGKLQHSLDRLQHSLDHELSDHRATERERLRVVYKHDELVENMTGLLQEIHQLKEQLRLATAGQQQPQPQPQQHIDDLLEQLDAHRAAQSNHTGVVAGLDLELRLETDRANDLEHERDAALSRVKVVEDERDAALSRIRELELQLHQQNNGN